MWIYTLSVFKSSLTILGIVLLVFSVNPAYAQIYKCKTEKNKIIYSDVPCSAGSRQTLTDVQPSLDNHTQHSSNEKSALTQQLDSAVKSAIANNELDRAEALASTPEQREWVATAKKEYAQNISNGRTEADLNAEKANSYECAQAKRNLEKEASSSSPEPNVLNAKTSIMRASCGQPEPAEVRYDYGFNPLFGYPYGYHFGNRFSHGFKPFGFRNLNERPPAPVQPGTPNTMKQK